MVPVATGRFGACGCSRAGWRPSCSPQGQAESRSPARNSPRRFALTFSSATPGAPSGLDVSAAWSDPGAVNGVPKAVTKLEFVGPPGTKFDTSALPRCRASDEDIANLSVRACPRSSKIGSVKGQGLIVTGNPFNTFATLFNAPRQIIVIVRLVDDGRLITYFRDDVRRSSVDSQLEDPGRRGVDEVRGARPAPLPQDTRGSGGPTCGRPRPVRRAASGP